ncbi:glycosyltransferase family 2 protein [Sulfurovum sp.]|jgi:glycosyltransferase involved in cell wall biosynthesis|uniref:glycosyltransferase family 2 protein n=1 Tax=Sulfurovum sp. TaxID=1969726 RepID=UPI002A364F96|nr:glycosyltransferase family 2 protein [Sulfurovum sp.]MDY0402703.1 glycosyltransferase family 2 protein [Sulfurovum sp.]
MQNELVSIAMATYNGEKYLKEQLDSIYNQTYKNIEVIVCDDYSSDKTIEILEEYSKKYGLKYYVNEKNLGFKKNFQKAINLCNGEYIALADQDDIWVENKLEVLVKNIGGFSLIHSACSLIDESSKEISPLWIKQDDFRHSFPKFIFGNTVTGCTVLLKRELLKNAFPIPSGEKYHDWWLALLATKMDGITYCDKALVKYRQHSTQDTGAHVDSILSRMVRYYQSLFSKQNSKRYFMSRQQVLRLKSFVNEKNELFNSNELDTIQDAITYYNNYINNFIHFKNFLISLKYHKDMYPLCKFYMKNIFRDLIG